MAALPWPFLAEASRYHSWRRLRRLRQLQGSQQARARTTACREEERARTMPILQRASPLAWGTDRVGRRRESRAVQRARARRRLLLMLVAMGHLHAVGPPLCMVRPHGTCCQVLVHCVLMILHRENPRLVRGAGVRGRGLPGGSEEPLTPAPSPLRGEGSRKGLTPPVRLVKVPASAGCPPGT